MRTIAKVKIVIYFQVGLTDAAKNRENDTEHVILATRGSPISQWQEQAKVIVLMSNSYEGVHQEKKKGKGVHG